MKIVAGLMAFYGFLFASSARFNATFLIKKLKYILFVFRNLKSLLHSGVEDSAISQQPLNSRLRSLTLSLIP